MRSSLMGRDANVTCVTEIPDFCAVPCAAASLAAGVVPPNHSSAERSRLPLVPHTAAEVTAHSAGPFQASAAFL